MSRSAFGISAIFASTSLSPLADFSSFVRPRMAARSSAVNPLDVLAARFFADFLSGIGAPPGLVELGDDEAIAVKGAIIRGTSQAAAR